MKWIIAYNTLVNRPLRELYNALFNYTGLYNALRFELHFQQFTIVQSALEIHVESPLFEQSYCCHTWTSLFRFSRSKKLIRRTLLNEHPKKGHIYKPSPSNFRGVYSTIRNCTKMHIFLFLCYTCTQTAN